MRIAFFGSSLVSAYWNGAAVYYRGIIRALADRGHAVTFFEPDAFDRQGNRDIDPPPWARVVVYEATRNSVLDVLEAARGHDLVIKASGVGVFDGLLEREVPALASPRTRVAFWDVDPPETLDRLDRDPDDPLRALVPRYDLVLTRGGGPAAVAAYLSYGARQCVPIDNAADPSLHHPVPARDAFRGDLGYLGNRLRDAEARVDAFFLKAARKLPEQSFVLAGAGWDSDVRLPPNVRHVGHVPLPDVRAFDASPLAVLHVNRAGAARFGFMPSSRLFEAAATGACIVSDAWDGLDRILEPGREVLVAHDGHDVAEHVRRLDPQRAKEIGVTARRRVLAGQTFVHRAQQLESALEGRVARPRSPLPRKMPRPPAVGA